MRPEDLYHAGIVVEDFDATLAWFTETAGYRWCQPYTGEQLVVTPDGEETIPMRLTYSVDEPHIEILQAVPGTVWMPADSGIHHLGYWSDEVDEDVAKLERNGLKLEVTAPLPDGATLFAYCKGAGRTRIELVNRIMQPMITEWIQPRDPHARRDASAGDSST
jgi:catechol 2,3-dioxygenase-like lactoylglutathione lyase family enzyme